MSNAAAPNAAIVSALLLLAVTGGFFFAYLCHLTRFPFRRMEGQQLYLASAGAAVVLLLLSRLIFLTLKGVLENPKVKGVLGNLGSSIGGAWTGLVDPLGVPGLLAAFGGAFLLGPICALLVNRLFSKEGASYFALRRYGSELEKFAYASFTQALPVSVTLDNRKVYVGWPTEAPIVEPKKYVEDYLRLLPLRSGYRSDKDLRLMFTTHYDKVYRRILGGEEFKKPNGKTLALRDFAIVIPVDRIVSVGFHAIDLTDPILDADSFEASEAKPNEGVAEIEGAEEGREP